MSIDNATTTRRIFAEVFTAQGIDRMDEFASPALVVHYAGGAEPLRGLDSYKAAFAADIPSFPDARYTIEELIGASDRVAVRWRMEATHQGTYQGIAPTGKRVALDGMSVYRFAEGRVAEGWVVADSLGLMRQLGQA